MVYRDANTASFPIKSKHHAIKIARQTSSCRNTEAREHLRDGRNPRPQPADTASAHRNTKPDAAKDNYRDRFGKTSVEYAAPIGDKLHETEEPHAQKYARRTHDGVL